MGFFVRDAWKLEGERMRKVKENKDCEWFEIDGGDLEEKGFDQTFVSKSLEEKKFTKKFVELEKEKR